MKPQKPVPVTAPKPAGAPLAGKASSKKNLVRTHLADFQWKKAKAHIDSIRGLLESKDAKSRLAIRPKGSKLAVRDKTAWADEEDSDEDVDPVGAALTGAASLFTNPNVTYEFRLSVISVLATTNAVQYFNYVSWDVTQFTEFSSYLKFLFNEVRIRRARITLRGLSGNNMGATPTFAICSDMGFTNTAPTTFPQVVENPNSMMMDSYYLRSDVYRLDVRVPDTYNFAPVNGPNPTTEYGSFGEFMIGQYTAAGATEPVFQYQFEGWYEFRSRT